MSGSKYHVGQELWRHDVNEGRLGGPRRVTVIKVARKLVTVADGPQSETFRIETARSNDAYAHGWLCTDEEHAAHQARSFAVSRLRSHGLSFDFGTERRHSTEVIAAIADLLDAATTTEERA